jgi:hypothetical protein
MLLQIFRRSSNSGYDGIQILIIAAGAVLVVAMALVL